jgi:hypothetical protein
VSDPAGLVLTTGRRREGMDRDRANPKRTDLQF